MWSIFLEVTSGREGNTRARGEPVTDLSPVAKPLCSGAAHCSVFRSLGLECHLPVHDPRSPGLRDLLIVPKEGGRGNETKGGEHQREWAAEQQDQQPSPFPTRGERPGPARSPGRGEVAAGAPHLP